MIAPITNEEKQKLLESISLESKMNTLKVLLVFIYTKLIKQPNDPIKLICRFIH